MKHVLAAAASLAAVAMAAPTAAETVNFEGLPTGYVGNPFTVGSLTFSTSGQLFIGPYGTQQLCPTQTVDCSLDLTLAFSAPASDLSFTISGADSSTSALIALVTFVGGGTATRTFTGFTGGTFNNLIDLTAFSDVRSVLLLNNDAFGFSYDNFNFNTVVPEPAAWGLMILGVGLVGGALRRRARTTVRFA